MCYLLGKKKNPPQKHRAPNWSSAISKQRNGGKIITDSCFYYSQHFSFSDAREKSEPFWPRKRMCDYFLFIYGVARPINGSRTLMVAGPFCLESGQRSRKPSLLLREIVTWLPCPPLEEVQLQKYSITVMLNKYSLVENLVEVLDSRAHGLYSSLVIDFSRMKWLPLCLLPSPTP